MRDWEDAGVKNTDSNLLESRILGAFILYGIVSFIFSKKAAHNKRLSSHPFESA